MDTNQGAQYSGPDETDDLPTYEQLARACDAQQDMISTLRLKLRLLEPIGALAIKAREVVFDDAVDTINWGEKVRQYENLVKRGEEFKRNQKP